MEHAKVVELTAQRAAQGREELEVCAFRGLRHETMDLGF
jgi:hypothetical protein